MAEGEERMLDKVLYESSSHHRGPSLGTCTMSLAAFPPVKRHGDFVVRLSASQRQVDQKTSFHGDLDLSWSTRERAMMSRISRRD
jgi:hypothetical protein